MADRNLYSDLHKDALGFRPSADRMAAVREMSDSAFEAEWNYLCDTLAVNESREKIAQARAATAFEAHVAETIAQGAGDRYTALRWIMDAENVNGDKGYLEYLWNLPYGYLSEKAAA